MSSRHLVRRGGEIDLAAPAGSNATGLRRWSIVDEGTPGAVHTGFAIVELAAQTCDEPCVDLDRDDAVGLARERERQRAATRADLHDHVVRRLRDGSG